MSDPRITLAICAHIVMTVSALWLIGTADVPLSLRIVIAALAAAILLPWLQSLAARRLTHFAWLGLLLVLIIGVGIVEVLATSAQWPASVLLGSAMLEFALLLSLSRGRPDRATNESAER